RLRSPSGLHRQRGPRPRPREIRTLRIPPGGRGVRRPGLGAGAGGPARPPGGDPPRARREREGRQLVADADAAWSYAWMARHFDQLRGPDLLWDVDRGIHA